MHRILALFAITLIAPTAAGQAFRVLPSAPPSQFPAQRNHQESFLQRPLRVPLEAILEVRLASDLIDRSLGKTPAFASAPVVGEPANPFVDSSATAAKAATGVRAGLATSPGDAAEEVGSPFGDANAQAAGNGNPFAAGVTGGDPFAEEPAASEPPAENDPFGGASDPFNF